MKKAISLSIAASVYLSGCASVEKTELVENNQQPKQPTVEFNQGVKCVSQALSVIRSAEYQGAARYAKKDITIAYDLLNQSINMLTYGKQDATCQTAKLSEKSAKLAIYKTVTALDAVGQKHAKPRPVRLDSAPVSKPKIIKASYEKKTTKAKDAHVESSDPLLPSSKWEVAKNDVVKSDNPSAKSKVNRNQNSAKASPQYRSKHVTPSLKDARNNMFVENDLFYRGLAKAENGSVIGLSQGSDRNSNYLRYLVQRNDTLWRISKKVFSDPRLWPSIFESNRRIIENPDLIYPGQALTFRPKDVISAKERIRLRNKAIAWDIQRRKQKK